MDNTFVGSNSTLINGLLMCPMPVFCFGIQDSWLGTEFFCDLVYLST